MLGLLAGAIALIAMTGAVILGASILYDPRAAPVRISI